MKTKFYYKDYLWQDLQTSVPFSVKDIQTDEIYAAQDIGFRLMLVKSVSKELKLRLIHKCMCVDWVTKAILNNKDLMEQLEIITKLQETLEDKIKNWIEDFLKEPQLEKNWEELEYYLLDRAESFDDTYFLHD